MALEIYEVQETRSANVSNGRATATRRFRIFDDATPLTTPNQIRELFGTSFGTTTLPDIGDEMIGDSTVFATGYSIRHVAESRGVWEVEFTYENTEPGQYQPQEVGYTEFSIEYSSEFREKWRSSPGLTIPSNGDSTNGPDSPCDGRKMDIAGEPMSVMHYFSNLTIAETVASTTVPERSQSIRAARGKRNETNFYGAPKGQVLYLGATASRISLDKYQIVHKFMQDSDYHMIQTPQRGPSGQILNIRPQADGTVRAEGVFWIQPFFDYADFNSISENF